MVLSRGKVKVGDILIQCVRNNAKEKKISGRSVRYH